MIDSYLQLFQTAVSHKLHRALQLLSRHRPSLLAIAMAPSTTVETQAPVANASMVAAPAASADAASNKTQVLPIITCRIARVQLVRARK